MLTLRMTFFSTAIATVLGVPLGLLLEQFNFCGKRMVVTINRTLMASPPVVVGLVVYLLLMRNGLFGALGLLFTLEAMVIAQVIIITPIVSGMTHTAACSRANTTRMFAYTMGATKRQAMVLVIRELSGELLFIVLTAFARAMSEVGAILIVGGNIRHHTRTMTTSISLMRNRGEFGDAIILGALLMGIVFAVQLLANAIQKKEDNPSENY